MAQRKAHEVEAWLARPDAAISIVLLYGPDRGLVSERAQRVARGVGVPLDDPFSVTRIDANAADLEAGRLVDEARTVSMFSARRLIWIRNAGAQKSLLADLEDIARKPPMDAVVLIEAGDLKKGAPLRSLVEASSSAMALPCYADEGKMLDALIDEAMRRNQLAITAEARHSLKSLLGGDRLASRGELEKLTLYAQGAREITEADIRAVIGDVSGVSADDMVERLLAGDGKGLSQLFARHVATAQQVYPVLAAALRQFQALHAARARMERERQSAAQAVAAMRPPPFGARKTLLEQALVRWTAGELQRKLARLQQAILQTRRHPELATALAERVLLGLIASEEQTAIQR